PNRGLDDPTLVRKIYDGSIIPANRGADAADIAARVAAFYQPYHDAIAQTAERLEAQGQTPRLLAIHSFTPALIGRPKRPWEIGILWDEDARMAAPLMASLRAEGICVGDNEPYTGQLKGDTMYQHGTTRGRPHVLIEIRNDLIATAETERDWAARLTDHVSRLA
ncbi:MAG: N-formylglutamate amidohydrolase, partial [Pseudomonadota bacterium]